MSVKTDPVFRFRSYMILALAVWTIIAISLILVNLDWMHNHILEIAKAEARASIEKDLLYRSWSAGHGGVYVPVTEDTPPNPYLNVPEREITTPSGKVLTLMNPAYMTRQVYELEATIGIRAHLTSLNPLNPDNKADAWETKALQAFEGGATEIDSVELINGEPYMRVMRPFITDISCLKCHASQRYKVGDIRGGLSVSMPMSKYAALETSSKQIIFKGYGLLWLVGIVGILLVSKDLNERFQERNKMITLLRKSEEEYRTILQTSTEGFWLVNQEGSILEVNDAYCSMTGFNREELLKMSINDLDAVENMGNIKERIQRIFSQGFETFETIHKCKNGEHRVVEASVRSFENGNMAAFFRDITEQKNAQDKLRASEEKYRLIAENMHDTVWLMDMNLKPIYISPSVTKLRGFTLEELQELPLDKNLTPESMNRSLDAMKHFLAPENITQTTSSDLELEFYKKDGSTFWSDNTFVLLRDEKENVIGILGSGRDITEKKKAEEQLRANEASLKQSQRVAHVGDWTWDTQTNKVSWSDEMFRIFGLDPEKFDGDLSKVIAESIHPDDREKINESNNKVLSEQTPTPMEYRVVWKDGSVHTVWAVPGGRVTDESGKILKLTGIVQDISDRKAVEESLRKNESLLLQAQQVANLGYYQLDFQSGIWESSNILNTIFGITDEYIRDVQGWAGVVHPDDREGMIKYFTNEVVEKGKNFDREYRIMRINDQVVRWVHGMGELQFDVNGSPIRMIGTIQDITERKQSEEALRQSEERFRTLVTSTDDIVFTLDTDERHTGVFGRWLEKSNTNPKSFIGRTALELMGSENGMVHHEANLRALCGEYVVYEWQSISSNNAIVYYQTSLSPIFNSTGKITGLVGIGHNITDLKKIENELRTREAHLQQAQNLSKIGTWEWDPITDKTTWSDEMLKIYGITREQFTGNGNDYINFTHPDDRPIQRANIQKDFKQAEHHAIETGEKIDTTPDPKEFRIIRPDGSICWVQGDAIEIVDEKGRPLRMLGILRDITTEIQDEQVIRASEERYRLLFSEMMDGFALHEIICDENGHPIDYRFLALNPAFEQLTGLSADQVVGKTVREVLPQTENFWIERYGKVALTGQPDHFEEFSAALNAYYEVRAFSPTHGQFAVVFHDISQRKHSENITLARMKFVEIATTHSLDTLVQTILDEAESLTGSRIGFYHFMEADQKTLTLQNWSTRTLKEFCRAEGKGKHYPVELAGIWADCIRDKRPVIHNNYASLLYRKGLPEGHAELIRELVVPVMRGDKVQAVLGVGNKATEYTQGDIDIVQQLADLAMEIVERKRAEDAQAKAQQNYESLIQTIDGIVWEADAQTFQFSFVSSQAEKLLGYPVQNWLMEPNFWANHIHPEDREHAVDFCVSQTQSMKDHEFEYRMITSDERVIWLRDMVTVISEKGRPAKLRGIMIDITEKKASEEKLHQLSLAVEQNPASVVITDLIGNIEYINPKFTEISGYTLKEVYGKNPRILKSGETSQETYRELWANITSGKTWRGELHNKKKNGELYWEDVMIAPLKDPAGRVTHFISVKEDITERKRAEEEIKEKNADLAALFSISAHLRTAASAKDMLPVVLQEMKKVLNTDANAVILLEPGGENFIYAQGDGILAVNEGIRFPVENSISGQVMRTRRPYITEDFANDPNRTSVILNSESIGCVTIVPLQSETEFLGVLLSARSKESINKTFTPAETQLLTAIGEMVGNAMRRARLYDDALLRMQRVQALRSIDAAITTNMDLNIILNILLSQAITIMNVDAADILTFNPHTLMLEFTLGQGFHTKAVEQVSLRLGEGLAGSVALERKPVFTSVTKSNPPRRNEILRAEGIQSMFVTPMTAKGQLRGVLELYSRSNHVPDDEWMDFLGALATQAAIAIDNTQLYNDLQRSNFELTMAYDATIEGWSHALDLKDKETEGHTLRVTDWTIKLARLAGLSDMEIVHIRRGALLHDIGKMGIPDRILNKTGKLTSQEWEIMRQHTIYAYNMIHPIEFLHPAIDIPYSHHEKWDGSGYPLGLKGVQIPYAARLFAIVDVWDALTSDRPYRKAWSFEKALDYITSESGKHFDPEVVNLFLILTNDLRTD